MNRRNFLKSVPAVAATVAAASCRSDTGYDHRMVMTVRGPMRASEMGLTLPHEHLMVDFTPYAEQKRDAPQYEQDEVFEVVLPFMRELSGFGFQTLIESTPDGLGRSPALLRRLSEGSGLNIVCPTGNYAAVEGQFLPPHVHSDSVDALAARWIDEWKRGIDGTLVHPGFIKLGVNGGTLSDVEQKLIRAAATAHLETGLTIGSHTGPALAAFEQLALLRDSGVDPSAWIWIHAQNEADPAQHARAAGLGAWVSFDGLAPESVAAYIDAVVRLRDAGFLHRTLVSHDAGWYSIGEPGGGTFRPFDTVSASFIPALRESGFTKSEVNHLFVGNPADAFAIRVRVLDG